MNETTIIPLDLNYKDLPETIASYLVIGPQGPVLVETGPASTLPTLKARLSDHGLQTTDIKHVLVTHIHLDHSGAAGWLAQDGAQIYVHPVGAPHLIDPAKLLHSAGRIYGDQMDILWGETIPAPAEKVTAVADNESVEVAGLTFTALDTPGHAWHHHTYRLGDVAFTGDAAGIKISGTDLVDLPAPPPEFKLEVWDKTIDRLLAENFKALYPTHFGRVDDPARQLSGLRALMQQAAEFVRALMQQGKERDQIVGPYIELMQGRARVAGLSDFTIRQFDAANPLYMSVDGIMRYWQRKWAKK
ncbi:MAG: MBL fold metallo-hydrolase [Candidatus Promineifilaceae bacterium]|nr:MBL fold metallo-hydrolase [Candidatus Promineifilaceae bacterium]